MQHRKDPVGILGKILSGNPVNEIRNWSQQALHIEGGKWTFSRIHLMHRMLRKIENLYWIWMMKNMKILDSVQRGIWICNNAELNKVIIKYAGRNIQTYVTLWCDENQQCVSNLCPILPLYCHRAKTPSLTINLASPVFFVLFFLFFLFFCLFACFFFFFLI